MAKLLCKTEIKMKVNIHVRDIGDIGYEHNILNVTHVEDVGDVRYESNILSVLYVGDV